MASDHPALHVLLEHPELSTDVKALCTAERVCKGWYAAVQQCSAGSAAVQLKLNVPVQHLCSFAAWLPKHAAAVSSIDATVTAVSSAGMPDGMSWESYHCVARQLLLSAMQVASLLPASVSQLPANSLPAAAAAAAAAPVTATGTGQQQGLWRLASFKSNLPGAAGLLAALPAHSLTKLQLDLTCDTAASAAALPAALARLSSLKQLIVFDGRGAFPVGPGCCLKGVAQLSQLTELQLIGQWPGSVEQLQQLLAKPLPLRRLVMRLYEELPVFDLSELTQLTALEAAGCLPYGSVLPAQLPRAGLQLCEISTDMAAAVQPPALQQLMLTVKYVDEQQLLRLAQLPALQHLKLLFCLMQLAAAAAPVWQHLPHLRELCILHAEPVTEGEIATVLAGLTACTALTKLDWYSPSPLHAVAAQGLSFCASLARLTRLTHLSVNYPAMSAGSALALTALTGLSQLSLREAGKGVGELAATALACNLRQLRHLDLSHCNLRHMACLAAIAQLTQLEELWVHGNKGFTPQGLMLLTGLTQLQFLAISQNAVVTDEVVEQFRVAWQQRAGGSKRNLQIRCC
jgi:hypothetical protein